MRARELIVESEFEVAKRRITDRVELECALFVAQIEDPYKVWRGSEHVATGISKVKSRLEDRIPLSTSPDVHYEMNRIFTKKFGHPYRNGVFATGGIEQAADYGPPYFFFPIGDFDFCWSTLTPDLYNSWTYYGRQVYSTDNLAEKFIEAYKYQDTNLPDAIHSKHEIMFWCKEYYLIEKTELIMN